MLPHRTLLAVVGLLLTLPVRAAEPPPPPALPMSSPAPKPVEKPPAEDDEHLRGELSLATVTNLGLLPSVAFGVDLDVGFRWRRTALAVEGRFLATPRFSVSADRSAEALAILGLVTWCVHRPFARALYSLDPRASRQTIFSSTTSFPWATPSA